MKLFEYVSLESQGKERGIGTIILLSKAIYVVTIFT